jgi:Rieske Fe-S protein
MHHPWPEFPPDLPSLPHAAISGDDAMERRSFLKWATNALGALFGTLLGVPAIAYLVDARNRPAGDTGFQTVARLSDLKTDQPHQVVLHDVRRDAWTLHPNDVIGRVWLIRQPNDEVKAFTTICPHLGCSINFEEKAQRFICPCHNGTFHQSGERVSEEELGATNPPPRGMDSVDVRVTDDPARPGDKVIAVKYQNFRQGAEEKILKE